MKKNKEELFLRSLDSPLDEAEKNELAITLDGDREFKKTCDQFAELRSHLLRREEESFGAFFPERIAHRIKSLKTEVDQQILFFFKKYQLIAIGTMIAFIVLNIVLSENLTLRSVLGFEEEQPSEEIVTVDLYQNLTE